MRFGFSDCQSLTAYNPFAKCENWKVVYQYRNTPNFPVPEGAIAGERIYIYNCSL